MQVEAGKEVAGFRAKTVCVRRRVPTHAGRDKADCYRDIDQTLLVYARNATDKTGIKKPPMHNRRFLMFFCGGVP